MSASNVEISVVDMDEIALDAEDQIEVDTKDAIRQANTAPTTMGVPQPLSTRASSNTLSPSVDSQLEKNESEQPKSNRLDDFSPLRKYTLLFIFCLAQILDTYNASSLFAAIPTLVSVLHMKQSDSVWLISGYQLTFSAFLLIVSFSKDKSKY